MYFLMENIYANIFFRVYGGTVGEEIDDQVLTFPHYLIAITLKIFKQE